MPPSFVTSQLFGIERFRQAGAIFLARFFGHLGEEILRSREQVIPTAFGLEFGQHERGEGFLFLFGKFGSFSDHLFQQSTHR